MPETKEMSAVDAARIAALSAGKESVPPPMPDGAPIAGDRAYFSMVRGSNRWQLIAFFAALAVAGGGVINLLGDDNGPSTSPSATASARPEPLSQDEENPELSGGERDRALSIWFKENNGLTPKERMGVKKFISSCFLSSNKQVDPKDILILPSKSGIDSAVEDGVIRVQTSEGNFIIDFSVGGVANPTIKKEVTSGAPLSPVTVVPSVSNTSYPNSEAPSWYGGGLGNQGLPNRHADDIGIGLGSIGTIGQDDPSLQPQWESGKRGFGEMHPVPAPSSTRPKKR